ncbi:MAG: MFS transporter [Anaerolineae bacterium]|jgi:MFS family permease
MDEQQPQTERDQPGATGQDRYLPSFYLLLVANLFFFTGFQWTFATLPDYVQAIGGNAAQIGLAFGLFSLSAVAARPLVGRLVDSWGRKPVLLSGALLFALSPALYMVTRSVLPFQLVRLLHGVGIAAFTTAYTTLVADLAPPGRRGEAIGLSGVTNNLGMVFAPALGSYTAAQAGWTVHFALSAGITAITVLLLLPVVEPVRRPAPKGQSPRLRAVVRRRTVWVAAFGITGLAVAYGAILSFLAPFAGERNLSVAGGYFTAFALAMMVAQAVAGWLSDRVGRRAVAIPGLVLVVLAMTGLGLAGSDAGLLAAGAVFGLSWGLARAGIDTSVVDAVSPKERGTAVGFLYTMFDAGVGVGSFGLGVVAQSWGYAAAFYAAAIWAAVALAGYLAWGRARTGAQLAD